MGKPVVHFEIGCKDLGKTQDFYSKLFGWTMQEAGPAALINTGAETGIHGHMSALGHEPFHYTIFYVQVDDVAAALKQAESLGGKTVVPPIDIPPAPSPGSPIRKEILSGCGRPRRKEPGAPTASSESLFPTVRCP